MSINEAVCREIQMHFGSLPPPKFTEKVLYKFSRFMHLKTKPFAAKLKSRGIAGGLGTGV